MRAVRFFITNLALKHRLPLLIATLLLVIISASTWASYRSVKESELQIGRERLLKPTHQLASLSQQSAGKFITKSFTGANDPAIRPFLHPPSLIREPAQFRSCSNLTPQDPNSLQVELWDTRHSSDYEVSVNEHIFL